MRRSKTVSGLLAGIVCATAILGHNAIVLANNSQFTTEAVQGNNGSSTWAITGIKPGAIQNGEVTIPDQLEGKEITRLGGSGQTYTFLGRNDVQKLNIGKNVRGATTYAFFGAVSLDDISINPENKALHFEPDDRILYANAANGGVLIKYLSPTPKKDFMIPDNITRIINLDHTRFGVLDLNNTKELDALTFAGAIIDTLKIKDAVYPKSHDLLYGAAIRAFDTSGSRVYESDGKALWRNGRLIKTAVGATFSEGYFEQFTSISPYAFHSIYDYERSMPYLPEKLIKDVVFSFYTQNEGVFMVNNEISFCYNYQKRVPTEVGPGTEYSPDIDPDQYEKIKALMYVGVPYNATGLFEKVFEMPYESAVQQADVNLFGDAALNAVSAVLYDTIDQKMPAEIRGIGYGPFSEDKVNEYIRLLQEAVANQEQYNFTPDFELENNILDFHLSDGKYISSPIQINALDGKGVVNNTYVFDININTPGLTVQGGGQTFRTGTPVILVSDQKPTGFSVSYLEQSLKYYLKLTDDVQNVLASATAEKELTMNTVVCVDPLLISKLDAATGEELPGAHMVLKRGEEIYASWISGNEPYRIENIPDGPYTLCEISAPLGYEIAEEIVFEVVDGKVAGGRIVMYDRPLEQEPEKPTPSEPEKPTPSEPEKPTPSEPEKPTPSEPEKPNPSEPDPPTPTDPEKPIPPKPGKPTPSKPVTKPAPNKPSQNGGNHGGSNSESPGIPPVKDVIEESEVVNVTQSEGERSLPKTGDVAAACLIALSSFGTCILAFRKKNSVT